jgi:hypothetical protein
MVMVILMNPNKTVAGLLAGASMLTAAYLAISPYKTEREIAPGIRRVDTLPQKYFFGLAGTRPGSTEIIDSRRKAVTGSNMYIAEQRWADVNGNQTLDKITTQECIDLPASVGSKCYSIVDEFLNNRHVNNATVMRKDGEFKEHGKYSGYGRQKQTEFERLLAL